MEPGPHITAEPVLMRWMSLELHRINSGIVTERKTLARLLDEKEPSSVTKDTTGYRFDPVTIRILGCRLTGDIRKRLRLPIVFSFNPAVPDSCSLDDEAALEAFVILGDLSPMRRFEGGKLWVGRAIVYMLMHRYPTAVQIMMV